MKTRYTGKSLERDVEQFNERMASMNHEYRFVVGYRNGYTAIDLATPEQLAAHCCQRNLQCGTPRECQTECYRYMALYLLPVHS